MKVEANAWDPDIVNDIFNNRDSNLILGIPLGKGLLKSISHIFVDCQFTKSCWYPSPECYSRGHIGLGRVISDSEGRFVPTRSETMLSSYLISSVAEVLSFRRHLVGSRTCNWELLS
ncbi:hypothetical protein PTKIN_Ptkin04bG0041700 [Pterospermum kingtungense]